MVEFMNFTFSDYTKVYMFIRPNQIISLTQGSF